MSTTTITALKDVSDSQHTGCCILFPPHCPIIGHFIIMGQTLSTLGGVVGYKHEYRTGPDGVAKTFVTVLDTSVFKRKIKLQLAIVHEPQQEEDFATGAATAVAAAIAAAAAEDREAAPRLDLIQEAVDDESTQPPADDDRREDHELPPLAFVDEEDDTSSTTSSTKLYPQPYPSRRAFSTGTADKAPEMTMIPSRQLRRARPQSVGDLGSGTGGRLSVQTVSDVVTIAGRNGKQRMMNRVRLSLHDQEEIILIPVWPSSKEEEEGTEGGLGGMDGEGKDKEDDLRAQRPSRCQSVTVSLDAREQLTEEGRARRKEEGAKGKEEEQKLSLEIEQVEGFQPLGVMTHYAASAIAT